MHELVEVCAQSFVLDQFLIDHFIKLSISVHSAFVKEVLAGCEVFEVLSSFFKMSLFH